MSKLTTLAEAITANVHDGDTVYLAGFTHMIPFAAGHEIIRQGRRDLTLVRATPDLIYDQLIAAGCCRKVIFSYAGNPGVGSLRVLRRAAEKGQIEVEEYSHFGLISRVYAGATRMPFIPMLSGPGSTLPEKNPNYRSVTDPFTGRSVLVLPPLNPDVAVVHVQRADAEGNCHLWGIIGEQREAAFAAERVIVTAEDIVSEDVIRADPNRTLIPGFRVAAVCHVPWCAHPSYTQGYYDRDNPFYLEWDRISADVDALQAWMDAWVYGVQDRAQYVDRLGPETLARLQVEPAYSEPVNYGGY